MRGLFAALVVAVLAACAESPESLLKSAKDYLAKSDEKAAVIQLRSALQKNPDLAEARYLLGKTLIDTGELPAAEKELRKALELKYPADQVVPTLVRALVAGGQYKKAIDEFGSASAAIAARQCRLAGGARPGLFGHGERRGGEGRVRGGAGGAAGLCAGDSRRGAAEGWLAAIFPARSRRSRPRWPRAQRSPKAGSSRAIC